MQEFARPLILTATLFFGREVCCFLLLSSGLHLCLSHRDHRLQRRGRGIQKDQLRGDRCFCGLSLLPSGLVRVYYQFIITCLTKGLLIIAKILYHNLLHLEYFTLFLLSMCQDKHPQEARWPGTYEDPSGGWHQTINLSRLWCTEGGWRHRLQVCFKCHW